MSMMQRPMALCVTTIALILLGFSAQLSAAVDQPQIFTAFVYGAKTELQSRFKSVYNLDSTRLHITEFTPYASPSGISLATAKFYFSGDAVDCNPSDTSEPSMLGDSLKPQTRNMKTQSSFAFPSGMSQMSMPSGMSQMSMPSGMSQMSMPSGMSQMSIPSGMSQMSMPSGMSQMSMPSGMSQMSMPSGMSQMSIPSGMSQMSIPSGMSGFSFPSGSAGDGGGGMSEGSGSTEGSGSDPCLSPSPEDMSMMSWQDIEYVFSDMDPQQIFNSLLIYEMWTDATTPNGPTQPSGWQWRLNTDYMQNAAHPRVGRVELQAGAGAMWGTVCFDTIPNDVAVALCNTMFPGTTSARAYPSGGGKGFIAISNLALQNGQVSGLLSSPTQKNNVCLHKRDLGLVCGTNVTDANPYYNGAVSQFYMTYNGLIASNIEAVTSGAVPSSSVVVLDHTGSDYMFTLSGDAGFTSRDLEWMLQKTNSWLFDDNAIYSVYYDVSAEPRDLPLIVTTTQATTTTAPTTSTTTTTTTPTTTNTPPPTTSTTSTPTTTSATTTPTTTTTSATTTPTAASTTTTPTTTSTTTTPTTTSTTATPTTTSTATTPTTSSTTTTPSTTTPTTSTPATTAATSSTTSAPTTPTAATTATSTTSTAAVSTTSTAPTTSTTTTTPTTSATTTSTTTPTPTSATTTTTPAPANTATFEVNSTMEPEDLKSELGSDVKSVTCDDIGTENRKCVVEFASSDAAGQAAAKANNKDYPGVYAATINAPSASPEESGSNTGLIIGVVVGVLVAAVIGIAVGVVVMRRRGANNGLYDMGSPLGDEASMGHFEMNDAIEAPNTDHSVNQPRPPLVDEDI